MHISMTTLVELTNPIRGSTYMYADAADLGVRARDRNVEVVTDQGTYTEMRRTFDEITLENLENGHVLIIRL